MMPPVTDLTVARPLKYGVLFTFLLLYDLRKLGIPYTLVLPLTIATDIT